MCYRSKLLQLLILSFGLGLLLSCLLPQGGLRALLGLVLILISLYLNRRH